MKKPGSIESGFGRLAENDGYARVTIANPRSATTHPRSAPRRRGNGMRAAPEMS
jgi:hypothetical protein